jgi:hypothetical protein
LGAAARIIGIRRATAREAHRQYPRQACRGLDRSESISLRALGARHMHTLDNSSERFLRAIELIDAYHARDPRQPPQELPYAQRMMAQLVKFAPNASEALRLAVRGQHIGRWEVPRASYPMTRTGYHAWRVYLYGHQAAKLAEILREAGYDDATIGRVSSLVRKERIKADAEAQTLEDVACLVFLEHEFTDFAAKHDEEKLIGILRRTWKKMSPRGREEAMRLALPPEATRLITKAIE